MVSVFSTNSLNLSNRSEPFGNFLYIPPPPIWVQSWIKSFWVKVESLNSWNLGLCVTSSSAQKYIVLETVLGAMQHHPGFQGSHWHTWKGELSFSSSETFLFESCRSEGCWPSWVDDLLRWDIGSYPPYPWAWSLQGTNDDDDLSEDEWQLQAVAWWDYHWMVTRWIFLLNQLLLALLK